MKKKQLLGILLAGTMMVGAAVPVFAADGDRVKITYAQWGNETETAATQAVADKFNSEQDKIEVEVVKIDHDTYVTKLNAMATAGELPDTGIMSEAGVLKFAENGLLADISSMYGEGDAKPLDALTFKYQGTPVAYSAANEVLNLWYNIDLLNEVCEKQNLDVKEMTPPASAADAWDWDTFVETAQKLTIDINGKNALDPDFDPNNIDIYGCTINTLPWQLEVWAKSNGGGYYSEDGSECTIDSPETVEALQRIADLSDVYHCAPPVTSAANALESSLGSKKVVMATDGAWNVGTFLGPSADFDYAKNLCFSENAVEKAIQAIKDGACIVTDTQMGKAGINKRKLAEYGGEVLCFMSDEDVAETAKKNGTTRAVASMEKAAALDKKIIFAIGNAPTALVRLYELIQDGKLTPELIIGVPVGFVNVVQSKELILSLKDTPYIVARGRKGGSNIAACICNALLYQM